MADTVLPDNLPAVLSTALDERVTDLTVLNDGLNLVVTVSTATEEQAYVLRRPNKFRATPMFNDLRTEYELLERLAETAVPTQTPVLFCDDESVLGEPFYLATYLEGAVVPVGEYLPERFRSASARERFGHLLVDTLGDVHGLPVDRFEGVCDRQTPRYQVDRAVDRLDVVETVTGRRWPRLHRVADRLRESAPDDPETALVHGDYRAGNVLLTGTDRPDIGGVLDWEVAVLADPLTELGYVLLYWRDPGDATVDLDGLASRYDETALAEVRELNESGLCPFTTEPGSPSRDDLIARYEAKTGRSFKAEQFYQAHAALMLATVWADLYRYAVEHGESSDKEPLVDYMGLVAEELLDGTLRG